MAIIVVSPGQKAQRVEQQHVGREDYLQQYVQANPETLPVEELKPGAKLLVISREFPTDSGPIDALAIDDDGDLYIVETKLAKNPDKRRVIAQMLDYGAALWNAGAEHFIATATRDGDLNEKIADAFSLAEDAEVASVISNVRANLEAGQFQFVVLMNQLDDRLRSLITFVNSNSRFRILGLELDFYRHGDLDILIPRLYGTEARTLASTDSGTRARKWSESDFFEQVGERLKPKGAARVRELYDWALRTGEVRFSTTSDLAAFNVAFLQVSRNRFFKLLSDGTLVLPLSRLGDLEAQFRAELRAVGFAIPEDAKKPMLPLNEWSDRMQEFMSAVTRCLGS
jgi:hypothetical protein